MAQLVEHIVHIDGVTGSSPVATTKDASKEASFPFILSEALSRSEANIIGKKSRKASSFRPIFAFLIDPFPN